VDFHRRSGGPRVPGADDRRQVLLLDCQVGRVWERLLDTKYKHTPLHS
jgi:hypothetical protein